MAAIIDISPLLSGTTAVWPGDTPLSRKVELRLEDGDSVALSSLRSTVHIGAHADAPNHYRQGDLGIGEVDLLPYWGPCLVVEVRHQKLIEPAHFLDQWQPGTERILFKTGSFPNPNQFNEDFAAFSPATMDFLGGAGVLLVGIDTPSVDPFDSKDLKSHHRMLSHGMRNLEGLLLDHVEPGTYELTALPLRLGMGFDASPVRAALRKIVAPK